MFLGMTLFLCCYVQLDLYFSTFWRPNLIVLMTAATAGTVITILLNAIVKIILTFYLTFFLSKHLRVFCIGKYYELHFTDEETERQK